MKRKDKLKNKKLIFGISLFLGLILIFLLGYIIYNHYSQPNYKIILNNCDDYDGFVDSYNFKVLNFDSNYCIVSVRMDDSLNNSISSDNRVKLLYRPLEIIKWSVSSKSTRDVAREIGNYNISIQIVSKYNKSIDDVLKNIPENMYITISNWSYCFSDGCQYYKQIIADRFVYEIILNEKNLNDYNFSRMYFK
jgi:hypothetical protein